MADDLETPHTFEDLAAEALRCLEESEKAHNQALSRRRMIRDAVFDELIQRNSHLRGKPMPSKAEVDQLTDIRVSESKKWKAAAGQNRWMIERSAMYSSAALVVAKWEERDALMEEEPNEE